MITILSLLKDKVGCLEKFYLINEEEIINFSDGNFENIEAFYNLREQMLVLIREIDDSLARQNNSDSADADVTLEMRSELKSLLKKKDDLVTSILSQDLQILSYIESEKNKIIKQLQTMGQGRKAIKSYAKTQVSALEIEEKP